MRATIAARSTSNAMHAEPQPAMAPLLAPGAEEAPFLRLWHGFLTGRVMVALTLLLFMATGLVLNQNTESWMVALCLAYLVSSIAVRVMSRRQAPRPQACFH